jgi:hypothetical protein
MNTETAAQCNQAPPPKFKLAPPRGKLKTGMPTDGLWILAGLPKAGKTSLSASIPNAILLELERGGADRIDGWVQEIPDIATFRQAVVAAVEEPSIKALVIDSLDVVSDWLELEVAEKYELESISERKEGVNGFAVWKELRGKFEKLIGYLKTSGKLAVLVAHSKEPRIDADGKVVVPAGIQVPGKLGSYIAAEADAIGHCYKKQVGNTTQYFVSFQGGPLGTYGSRIPELEDKTITLPKTNQWAAIQAAAEAKAPTAEPAKALEKKPSAKTKGGK